MKTRKTIVALTLGSIISACFVIGLYLLSEDTIHRQKDVFIRRYPHHPANQRNALDLGYNSYYIAGVGNGNIYLGNNTAPAHLIIADTILKDTTHVQIHIGDTLAKFSNPIVRVNPPDFFVIDGTMSRIYKGNTVDWKAYPLVKDNVYFSKVEVMDANSFVFLSRSDKTKENILGKMSFKDSIELFISAELLEKQIDGVFCTDGMLLFERDLQKMVYVYNYRNQFIVADANLIKQYVGKTIDTISRAQITVDSIQSEKVTSLGGSPLVVNHQSSIHKNYLFISSNMLGKYEEVNMLEHAAIIDIYDINDNTYQFSFYLYRHKQKRMKDFQVYGNLLVAIAENYVVTYKLEPRYFKGMRSPNENKIKTAMN